jgi:GT2 family glycosyltransferase
LPAACFNQYNVAVSPSSRSFFDSDFARPISRKFEHGRFLVIGGDPQKLERQFAEAKRKAVTCSSHEFLSKLSQDAGKVRFETAVWFYTSGQNDDERITEELSRCADSIVLIPGPGADASRRRRVLVQCFSRFGFVPDYECDVLELNPGAVCLRRLSGKATGELVPAVETAFARFNKHLGTLRRTLEIRDSELEGAHRHIAGLEEKLLKLKQYRRELKLLKEEKRFLRKSAERRVGQILLGPYRLPEKLAKTMWKKFHKARTPGEATGTTDYEKWFERHRMRPQDLQRMRDEVRTFASQPLVSIITPVFNTPVPWLREALESVLAQAYENWELILIDDGSSASDLLHSLPALAARDRRVTLAKLENHQGISAASNHGLALARGEWVTFLDHDDVLEPDALFQNVRLLQENPEIDLIYSDEDKITEQGFDLPILKPDWSPDFLLSSNYLCHMIFLRRELARDVGEFRSKFDGSQDYDLLLRVIERTNRIAHIPRVLYHWRRSQHSSAGNVRQKPNQLEASRQAIEDHLKRRGESAHVAVHWRTHAFCVRRELIEPRKISVIIASRHGPESLDRCLESLTTKTSYPNYEIVIIQRDDKPPRTTAYFSRFQYRLLSFSGAANGSAAKNYAVEQTDASWLLFLDDSIEVIDPGWLTMMAEHIQRSDVGAVGARLLNPDDTIQHAGIVLGVDGIAQAAFRGLPAEHPGVNRQLQMTRNYSAVSGACILTRRDVFQEVGGFDENLSESLGDVDLCLKIRRASYLIVYTPFAKLYQHEPRDEKIEPRDEAIMRERWSTALEQDPYYNPNLCRERADFSLGK